MGIVHGTGSGQIPARAFTRLPTGGQADTATFADGTAIVPDARRRRSARGNSARDGLLASLSNWTVQHQAIARGIDRRFGAERMITDTKSNL